jgi:tRNA G18 (ribose-2'-O)-methylase SpoU
MILHLIMPDSEWWPLFQDLRFAGSRVHPQHGLCFVAEGRILVEDLLAWGRRGRVRVLAVLGEAVQAEALAPRLPVGTALLTATRRDLEALVGFPFHRGLLAAAVVPAPRDLEGLGACRRLLVLPAVADAENLGLLLRSAAALGLDGALLGPGPDPFSRRAVRVSMGAVWKLPLWRTADLWAALAAWGREGGQVVGAALDSGAVPVRHWVPVPRTALVLGPEGPGLDRSDLARCDLTVGIPMAPDVDSLNVAAAGAILMHWLMQALS